MQSLDSLAAAVHDPVTHQILAAVGVVAATGTMPSAAPVVLRSAVAEVTELLQGRARQVGTDLVRAFARATRQHAGAVPTLALDAGGRVVVANKAAARLFGVPAEEPLVDPGSRRRLDVPDIDVLVEDATRHACGSQGWTGTGHLLLPREHQSVGATFTAVGGAAHPIGFLLTVGVEAGEPFNTAGEAARAEPATFVVAQHAGGRSLLLRPTEIRYACAEGNTVWLVTDRGRLRAAVRGLKTLEQQLEPESFLRVHRGFLVNLRRVREVDHGLGHELLLFFDSRVSAGARPVPVARGRARLVRSQLGL